MYIDVNIIIIIINVIVFKERKGELKLLPIKFNFSITEHFLKINMMLESENIVSIIKFLITATVDS